MDKKESGKETLKIILDSNAFFVPLQFKIDIFEELKRLLNVNFELVLLSPILQELKKLANESSQKIRKQASYALKLAEKCKFVEINGEDTYPPDDLIVKIAKEWNSPVFTNDTRLRRRLRNINVPVIYVRQKSYLEINGRV